MRISNVTIIVLILGLTGCASTPSNNNTPTNSTNPIINFVDDNKQLILASISAAAKAGAQNGLAKWAQTDNVAATEAANQLVNTINNVLLPYVIGGPLHTSAEINSLINSSIFDNLNLDPVLKLTITTAAALLDGLLIVPSDTTYLSSDQIDYLNTFLIGLRDGCTAYLANPKVMVKTQEVHKAGRWFSPKK